MRWTLGITAAVLLGIPFAYGLASLPVREIVNSIIVEIFIDFASQAFWFLT
jgi:hypothetical protein